MKFIKILIKIWTAIIFIAVLFIFGVGYYLKTNKTEIIKEFEDWYTQNYNGVLTFEDVSISTFKNFPSVAIEIKNVAISDTIYRLEKTETFNAGEIHLLVSFEKILHKQIQFKSLKVKNGSLKLITDVEGNNNHNIFKEKERKSTKKTSISKWFSKDKIKINIENFDISLINHQKNKRITGKINELKSNIIIENDLMKAEVNLDVFMNEMGLNLDKGTFFNGATLVGKCNPVFNKKTQEIDIPFFDLKIDEQIFKVKALVKTEGKGSFNFVLENQNTVIKSTVALLSQNIQKNLKKYNIAKPIYTYTTLEGSFEHGSNPLVKINGKTSQNSVQYW